MNSLNDNFQARFAHLLQLNNQLLSEDFLIDSMPVILAVVTRAKRARVTLEIAKTGFCAIKQINFHGVRLHLIGNRRAGYMPIPAQIRLKEGNVHDLTVLREIANDSPSDINLFANKAYAKANFKIELASREIKPLTPFMRPKKEALPAARKQLSRTVSSFRGSVESYFK